LITFFGDCAINYTKGWYFIKITILVLGTQRAGTARVFVLMTIKDETGFANLVSFEKLFEQFRKEILLSRFNLVVGKAQIEVKVTCDCKTMLYFFFFAENFDASE